MAFWRQKASCIMLRRKQMKVINKLFLNAILSDTRLVNKGEKYFNVINDIPVQALKL